MISTMTALLTAACLLQAEAAAPARYDVAFDFNDDEQKHSFVATAIGESQKRRGEPKIQGDQLYLLPSWWKSTNAVGFAAPTMEPVSVVEASWTLVMNTGTEGAGFAWLSAQRFYDKGPAPEIDAWEAPSIESSFGIGFDASNPPNRDPFRGSGNIYDRPQHEISLHFDGMELVKRTTPMDFRDEEPHRVDLRIEFVTGGAEVTLAVDETVIYDAYFIPSMTAYAGRAAFGARNSETAGDILIDDLSIACIEPVEKPSEPLHIVAIDRKINDKDHPKNEATVDFPDETDRYGRVICTLRLDQPETRFDPWDRFAAISIFDDEGEKYELLRYITPYHKGHVWQVDVTEFRPLLKGTKRIEQACGTQGEGWVVSVMFDFHEGPADRYATRIVNLWQGAPEVGNPDKPVTDFYTTKKVSAKPGETGAVVRTVVTGHGMSPNTNNAAEFMPLGRTLTVNGESSYNMLWKTDNYLNPCRPQGGTWKYDRAGWAPGDVVRPWAVDVSHLLGDSAELTIDYVLDEYINEARGKTWAPTHNTQGRVVFYREP